MNINNVNNMRSTSEYCSVLCSLEFPRDFRTPKVKYMNKQFCGCESLSVLNLSSFNTSDVANTSYVFFFVIVLVLLH